MWKETNSFLSEVKYNKTQISHAFFAKIKLITKEVKLQLILKQHYYQRLDIFEAKTGKARLIQQYYFTIISLAGYIYPTIPIPLPSSSTRLNNFVATVVCESKTQ